MSKRRKTKIISVTSLVLLAIFGYLFFKPAPKLSGTLTEIPNEIRTQTGIKYYDVFENNSDKSRLEVESTEIEYKALGQKNPTNPTMGNHKWMYSYSKPLYSTSTPVLNDNQFFATGGKDPASTTREVKVKYPDKVPEIKYENQLLRVISNPFLISTAFATTPPVAQASSTATAVGGSSSITYSHTVNASLSNAVLFVMDTCNDTNTGITTTWNGTALTDGGSNSGVTNKFTHWSYLINPTAATGNTVSTINGGTCSIWSASITVTGVNQTTVASASTTNSGTFNNQNFTYTLTSVIDELLLEAIVYDDQDAAVALRFVGANQVSLFAKVTGTTQHDLFGDYKNATNTGSNAMTSFVGASADGSRITSLIISISEPAAAVVAPAANEDIFIFE